MPEISEEEKPFQSPEGWGWVRFGVLPLEASTGLDKGKSLQSPYFEYLYFKMNNIMNDGGFDLTDVTRVDASPAEVEKYSLEDGDFLFNTRNSRELVGKTCVIRGLGNEPVLYNNNILRARLLFVSPEFVDYWFRSFFGKQLLEKIKSNTTNVCAIYQGKFFETMKPQFPPLAEQLRIVAKVDELMAICDQLERQQTDSNAAHQTLVENLLTTLTDAADQGELGAAWQRIANHFDTLFTTEHSIDQLKQTILQLAVMGKLVPQDPNDEPASVLLEKIAKKKAWLVEKSEIKKQEPLPEISEEEKPFQSPEGWGWVRFGVLPLEASTGLDKGKSLQSPYFEYLYFKMNNIMNDGGFDLTDVTRVDASPAEVEKYSLEDGDFLFNTRNSRELVGKTCVIRGLGNEPVLYNNNILRARLLFVSPEFVDYWFRSFFGKQLLEKIKSNTTNVCAIYQGKFFETICVIPPLAEQLRIVAKVDELMVLCDTLKTRLNDAQTTQIQLADTIVEQAVV